MNIIKLNYKTNPEMSKELILKNNNIKLINYTTAHIEDLINKFKNVLEKYCGIKSININSKLLQNKFYSIYLTSGNDESNKNLIYGISNSFIKIVKKKPHIIICDINNSRLLQYLDFLKKNGNIYVDIISPNIYGLSTAKIIEKYIKNTEEIQTCLIIINYINISTGSINNIKKISNITKKYNIPLHVNCNWAFGYIPINPYELGINSFVMDFKYISGINNIGLLIISKNLLDGYQLNNSIQDLNYKPTSYNKIDPISLLLAIESIKLKYNNRKNKNKKLANLHQLCLKNLKNKYNIMSLANFLLYNNQNNNQNINNNNNQNKNKNKVKLPLIYLGAYDLNQYQSQIPHIIKFIIPKENIKIIEYKSIELDLIQTDEILLYKNLYNSIFKKNKLSIEIFNNIIGISFSDNNHINDINNFTDYISKIYN
jgi:hypothetical protein